MRQLSLKDEGEKLTSRTPRAKHAADCRRWAGIDLLILFGHGVVRREKVTPTGKNKGIPFSLRVEFTSIQSTPH